MSRGKNSKVGDEFTSKNGYVYTKTEKDGWVAVHRQIAEKKLGRPLHKGERVKFVDGDRKNLSEDNIRVTSGESTSDRIAWLRDKIRQYQEELNELERDLINK